MIRFVRKYEAHGRTMIDAIYENRVYSCPENKVPETVKAFMQKAKKVRSQYDDFLKRQETIFE